MNQIVNKFLLEGDKFMPEMYLRQRGLTYSPCGHLLEIRKEYKNLCNRKIQIISAKMN